MKRWQPYLFWLSKIVIVLGFLLASSGKLTKNAAVIQMFQDWGYPDGFYYLIGLAELGLAILLLIPKTSLYAAYGLVLIMIGALVTHTLHDPVGEALRPIIFLLFLALIIYLQRGAKQEIDEEEELFVP